MNYPDSVRFLYSLANESRTAELGLARMRVLLAELGDPHRSTPAVHVAGTNGKGSTCAMIAAAARAAGLRTGLYTSPHLVEPTERIRIDGQPVSPEQFVSAFHRVHQAAERLIRQGAFERHPTYFETVTAMAFVLFQQVRVDLAVLEVGLGGRLDATNVVHPRLAVITPVDFDHERYLGRSLEAIAREKAGILKAGAGAVFAPQRSEVAGELAAQAAALGIEPIWVSQRWRPEQVELDPDGSRFVAVGPRRIPLECPLPGAHQITNALTAAAALTELGIPSTAIAEGIRTVRWPGRLERVRRSPAVYLDGAHNPAGARALAAYIGEFHRSRRVWLIYGSMRDKAVEEVASILFPLADEVIATAPAQPRAVRPELIRELVDHPRLRTAATCRQAFELLGEAGPDDVVFVTGSLFLVGEARALLVGPEPPATA